MFGLIWSDSFLDKIVVGKGMILVKDVVCNRHLYELHGETVIDMWLDELPELIKFKLSLDKTHSRREVRKSLLDLVNRKLAHV